MEIYRPCGRKRSFVFCIRADLKARGVDVSCRTLPVLGSLTDRNLTEDPGTRYCAGENGCNAASSYPEYPGNFCAGYDRCVPRKPKRGVTMRATASRSEVQPLCAMQTGARCNDVCHGKPKRGATMCATQAGARCNRCVPRKPEQRASLPIQRKLMPVDVRRSPVSRKTSPSAGNGQASDSNIIH